MRKIIILLVLLYLCLIQNPVNSQTPINDAQRLNKIDITELDRVLECMNNDKLISDEKYKYYPKPSDFEKKELLQFINFLKNPLILDNYIDYSREIIILKNVGKYLQLISNVIDIQKNISKDTLLNNKILLLESLKNYILSNITDTNNIKEKLSSENNKNLIGFIDNNLYSNPDTMIYILKSLVIQTQKEQESNAKFIQTLYDLSNINPSDYINKKENKLKDYSVYYEDKKEIQELNETVKATQTLSGINETALIQALASFIAKKIQENLQKDVKEILFKDSIAKYLILFPETSKLLNFVELKNISEAARRAIFTDLKNILKNIDNLSDEQFTSIFGVKFEDLRKYFKISYKLTELLNSKTHPIEIFTILKDEEIFQNNKNLKMFFELIDFYQESLRYYDENNPNDIWISVKQLNKLDDKEKKFLVSKIYHNIKVFDKDFKTDLSDKFIEGFNNKFEVTYQKFSNDLFQISKMLGELKTLLISLSTPTQSGNDNSNMNQYFTKISDFINKSSEICSDTNKYYFAEILKDKIDTGDIKMIANYSQKVINIYCSIKDGKFTSLIPPLIDLVKEVKGNKSLNYTVFSKTLELLNLYVELVNAKSADEMETVISNSADVSGGHIGKLEKLGSVYINAYGGINFGNELIYEKNIGYSNPAFVMGLSAPVGLEWVLGGNAFGIFASLIDIGSVVSWRFEGTENVPNTVTLKQVFSPGIFAKFAPIKKSALTFMIGAQFSPSLREVTNNGITTRANTLKFGLNIAYDIPLLRF